MAVAIDVDHRLTPGRVRTARDVQKNRAGAQTALGGTITQRAVGHCSVYRLPGDCSLIPTALAQGCGDVSLHRFGTDCHRLAGILGLYR